MKIKIEMKILRVKRIDTRVIFKRKKNRLIRIFSPLPLLRD